MTEIVKLKRPLAVGVPEMTACEPPVALSVRPGGNAPLEIEKV